MLSICGEVARQLLDWRGPVRRFLDLPRPPRDLAVGTAGGGLVNDIERHMAPSVVFLRALFAGFL